MKLLLPITNHLEPGIVKLGRHVDDCESKVAFVYVAITTVNVHRKYLKCKFYLMKL